MLPSHRTKVRTQAASLKQTFLLLYTSITSLSFLFLPHFQQGQVKWGGETQNKQNPKTHNKKKTPTKTTHKKSIWICNIDTFMHMSVLLQAGYRPHFHVLRKQMRDQGRNTSWTLLLIYSVGLHHALNPSTLNSTGIHMQRNTEIYGITCWPQPLPDSILKIQDQ